MPFIASTDEAFREIPDLLILGALRKPCHYIINLLSSELLPYFQNKRLSSTQYRRVS